MAPFTGRLAVVTGAGSGIGRELVRQLVADGCHVAMCDLNAVTIHETGEIVATANPSGVLITSFVADASSREQMQSFAEAVGRGHGSDHIDLLFNNAGVGGGESFIESDEHEWQRTFDVCWGSVYATTRAFLPMLMASTAGYIVNVSSINGIYPSLGPGHPASAYSTAKYAVKGFTESLIHDLRAYAPNIRPVLVMPGRISSSIATNTNRFHGRAPLELDDEQVAAARRQLASQHVDTRTLTDEEIRELLDERASGFDADAPVSSAEAATIVLDGIRAGEWRIRVGDDAVAINHAVRRHPKLAFSLDRGLVRWYFVARFNVPVLLQKALVGLVVRRRRRPNPGDPPVPS